MAQNKNVKVEYRINTLKTISFIGTGVLLDVVDFALGITGIGEIADEIIDVAADIAIPGMAWAYGIPLAGKKADQRLFTMIVCEVAKLVPLVNILPEYTYETWKLIDFTRQEDRERATARAKQQEKQNVVQLRQAARSYQIRQQQLAQAEQNQLEVAAQETARREEEHVREEERREQREERKEEAQEMQAAATIERNIKTAAEARGYRVEGERRAA